MKAIRTKEDAILTKEQATEWAERLNNEGGTYYLRHGEYDRPTYKAVKCKEGWKVRKTNYFLPGTIMRGFMLHEDTFCEYEPWSHWAFYGQMYMNPATGSVAPFEEWWIDECDEEGQHTGKRYNAVDCDEVIAVNRNAAGEWVEAQQ